ncbi:MAG TPA: hypothetical protein VGC08_12465 [Pedobacter sp.]
MKTKICLMAMLLMAIVSLNVNAQRTAISATAGTQGLGLELKYSPVPEYGIHGGFSILPVNTSFAFTAKSTPSNVDLKADFQNAHLMFDWHPFQHAEGIRKFMLSAGGGYFWKNTGTAVITSSETYKYGDIVIGPGDAGQLNGKVKWQRISPYAGIGFESAIPDTKFNLGFVLGLYYLGKPETSLTGTKLVSVDDANQEQFRKNLTDYRFLPVIQLNLNYSLN